MGAPLFDDADLAELRVLKEGALLVRAVGGLEWTLTRASGDGMSGPATDASAGTLTGEVTQGGDTRVASTQGGASVGDAPWVLTYWSGTTPQLNDTIASASDPTARFTVLARAADYLHPTWILERLP